MLIMVLLLRIQLMAFVELRSGFILVILWSIIHLQKIRNLKIRRLNKVRGY